MDTQESWTDQPGATARNTSFGKSQPIREPLLTAEFTQRLDLVRHLAANSDRIPLVRGVHGAGKSTLLGLLLQQAPADWEIYRIDATPMLQPEQLMYGLCHHFSVQQENSAESEQLVQRFAQLRQRGRLPVIIVDDAEQLPVTTLLELFRVYSASFSQAGELALILFASPQIDDLLEETRLQFASQRLQLLELLPLNREQSDQLVRHLFKVLEGQQGLPFSEAGYEKIFRTSSGLPGKINQQVERILRPETTTPATLAKRRIFLPQLLADVSPPVLIGGGILALLLLLTLVYEEEINAVFEPDGASSGEADIATVENRRVVPLALPDPPLTLPDPPLRVERDESVQTEEEEAIIELTVSADELSENSAAPDLPPKPLSNEMADAPTVIVVDLPQLTTPGPVDQIEDQVLEQPSVEPPITPPISAASETSKPVEKAVSETVIPAEKTALTKALKDPPERIEEPKRVEVEVAAEKKTSPKIPLVPEVKTDKQMGLPAPVTELGQAAKRPDNKSAPEPVTLTHSRKKPTPAPVQEDGIRREAWLLRQSPGSFTLQLIGVGDEQAVTAFIQRHKLQGDTAYFRTKSNGRPWFPVLYGTYPNRTAAVAARSKLPQGLSSQGVWPRSLASVQQAIRGE